MPKIFNCMENSRMQKKLHSFNETFQFYNPMELKAHI